MKKSLFNRCVNKDFFENLPIRFWKYIKDNNLQGNIYNEFSFQHELGIYLRFKCKGISKDYLVLFERNTDEIFNKDNKNLIKKEIDILLVNKNNDKEKYAIELKYPTKGAHQRRMFQFIQDIKFMEQLKRNGFTRTFVFTLVDKTSNGQLFYDVSNNRSSDIKHIYRYFRDAKEIHGEIINPRYESLNEEEIKKIIKNSGRNDRKVDKILIEGRYVIKWRDTNENRKYYFHEISLPTFT